MVAQGEIIVIRGAPCKWHLSNRQVTRGRRSDKHILCDSFNIQNGKNYAMFSIYEYYFHMQNNIYIYKRSFSPMFSGEVILSV